MKMRPRVIPVLLMGKNGGLVKGQKFKDYKYLGDPINTVRIFNDKEVDEILVLDIMASKEGREPRYELLKDIATEAFMPLGYGGALKSVDQIRKILSLGFEKVCLNTTAIDRPALIKEAADTFGVSTVVVAIDIKKNFWGSYKVFDYSKGKNTDKEPLSWAQEVEALGAGEVIINCVDRDGLMVGYELEMIKKIATAVKIPVVASGGAGSIEDFESAIKDAKASAVAAGSFFVFHGPHRAFLISYPRDTELRKRFQ